MTVRLRHPALVALCLSGALLAAPAALAAGGKHSKRHPAPPSAQQVYSEGVPTAGGSHPVGSSGGVSGSGVGSGIVGLSESAAASLAKSGGKDRSTLKQLATNPKLGAQSAATSGNGQRESAAPPEGALHSAVSLGWGPTVLFAVLLGSAIALAAYAGLRRLRR